MRGFFITIYGVNNIGKTTHAKLLTARLKKEGYDAVYIKYPIYSLEPTGPEINNIIRSDEPQQISETQLQTLFMRNRLDFEPQLKEMLNGGKVVVAEDYTGTGIAWGTAKGMDRSEVEKLNDSLMKEDFTILMKGNRDRNVIEKKHIHEHNDELIRKAGEVLDELAKKHSWKIVELREKIPDTAQAIWKVVAEFLAAHRSK